MRVIRLIENLITGCNANSLLVETVHGAGSPETQRAMLQRLGNLDFKRGLAKRIAGIRE